MADSDGGWVVIGTRGWLTPWIGVSSTLLMLVSVTSVNILGTLSRALEITIQGALGIIAIVLAVLFVMTTLILNRRWPQAAVNLATSELRSGKRVVPLTHFDSAVLTVLPVRKQRIIVLKILAGKQARADFVLRDRKGRALDEKTNLVLAEALRRTSIAMPVSKADPTGRFGRYNFPGHLTRDEAVALAANPPTRDDALPISS